MSIRSVILTILLSFIDIASAPAEFKSFINCNNVIAVISLVLDVSIVISTPEPETLKFPINLSIFFNF